jgi:copper(I)-binding protein
LVRVTSNVSAAGTLTPYPIAIPARATVHAGTGSITIMLPVTASLDPGETLAITLTFANSGHLLVYALSTD